MKGLDATRENVILYILLFIILLFTLDMHCEQYPDLNNEPEFDYNHRKKSLVKMFYQTVSVQYM